MKFSENIKCSKKGRDRIRKGISQKKSAIITALAENSTVFSRWQELLDHAKEQNELEVFLAREFLVFPTYLMEYFDSLDDTYLSLYIGEKLKLLYDKTIAADKQYEYKKMNLEQDISSYKMILSDVLNEESQHLLYNTLNAVNSVILDHPQKKKNILFIGDCVFMDIFSFIVPPLMEMGISINPTFATSKNHFDLIKHLKEISSEKYDLVFYSPLTYRFNLNYDQILEQESSKLSLDSVDAILNETFCDIKEIIDLISDIFDSPIFIHNSANVIRRESPINRLLKHIITKKNRDYASVKVTSWLEDLIQIKNDQTYKHLFLFNEDELARSYSHQELGRYIYRSELNHPANFSLIMADLYIDIIYTASYLMGKKMVVCDLDHTLWDGVIGEGDVRHYNERQRGLLKLKSRGIVLSINSKNDPQNICWNGGMLSDDDFVSKQISWRPKTEGFRVMEEELNISGKDFVFIDDRSDERAMASDLYPEMICLDPNDQTTWKRFSLWCDMLDEKNSIDRTKQYQERESRKKFLHEASESDVATMEERFKGLNIKLAIGRPGRSDLKRVEELINKTNQFNTRGVRTSPNEIESMFKSDDIIMLQGDYSDKFGSAGIISCLIARKHEDYYSIDYFVLSCRVFGYRIENTMLNELKKLCKPLSIRGEVVELERNEPCRRVYAENGFIDKDGLWIYDYNSEIQEVSWLNLVE